jgi:hypothetical protein
MVRATVASRSEPKAGGDAGFLRKARVLVPEADAVVAESGPARHFPIDLKRVSLYPRGGSTARRIGGWPWLINDLARERAEREDAGGDVEPVVSSKAQRSFVAGPRGIARGSLAPSLARPAHQVQAAGSGAGDAAERQADEIGAAIGADLSPAGEVRPGRLPQRVADVAARHLGVSVEGARLQDGPEARAFAARERALAVTVGDTVRFAGAIPSIATAEGRALLGHELVHVAQQRAHGLAVPQRKAIKDTSLASKLVSVSLRKLSTPQIVRTDHPGSGSIDLHLTKPLEVEATAQFVPGPHLSGLQFGFFQLGRPYELYRATQHLQGVDPAVPDKDLNIDLTTALRAPLPELDHTKGAVFYESAGLPVSQPADASGKVKVKYTDYPSTPFAKEIEKPPGSYYGLSGIAAQSWFFSAFGAFDGKDAIMLATWYWDMQHCENVAPGTVAKDVKGAQANVAPFRYCNTGGCDLGEPGADKFGTPATNTFLSAAGTVIYNKFMNVSAYDGPGTYNVACAQAKGKQKGKDQ